MEDGVRHRISDEEIEEIGVENLSEEQIHRLTKKQVKKFTRYVEHAKKIYDLPVKRNTSLMWLEATLTMVKKPGWKDRLAVIQSQHSEEKRKKTGKRAKYVRGTNSVSAEHWLSYLKILLDLTSEITDKEQWNELNYYMLELTKKHYPNSMEVKNV